MVHEKNKSGDPDYDDKVPANQHGGEVVTAGDGRKVLLSESVGPVEVGTGLHVDLDNPVGDEGDNRPAPGEVATEASSVQTYTAEDTAPGKAAAKEADSAPKEEADSIPAPTGRNTRTK